MVRNSGTLAAAVGLALALAAPAGATRAYVNFDSLVVSAGPGEVNAITITPNPAPTQGLGGAAFLVSDSAKIEPGPGCKALVPTRVVSCQSEYPVASLSLSLNDRNDAASVDGAFFYEQVDAGAGADRLDLVGAYVPSRYSSPSTYVSLGAGDDELELDLSPAGYSNSQVNADDGDDTVSVQGMIDYIDCGNGLDTARADYVSYTFGCETLLACEATSTEPACLRRNVMGYLP